MDRESRAGQEPPSVPDGWFVPDPEEFGFLQGHLPPRPAGYLPVLLNDARHAEPLAMWGSALGLAAVGLALGMWWIAAGGALALAFYAWGVARVVRSRRHSVVIPGVIESWDGALTGRFMMATARLSDGRAVRVVLHRRFAPEVTGLGVPVEVLVLHSPWAQLSSLIGLRAGHGMPEELGGVFGEPLLPAAQEAAAEPAASPGRGERT